MRRLRLPHRPAPRRGALLIIVMICLVGITALAGTLLKLAVVQQRQSRIEQRQLQAEWLATAALDRAAARRRQDAGWTGETWTPLGEGNAAAITVATDADRVEITAIATIPNGDQPPVRVTRRRRVGSRSSDATGAAP